MSKAKKSKLDQFAERLDDWFGVEKKTILEVQAQLKLDGCLVSTGRLSEWWQLRQQFKMQKALLAQIATGARHIKEVEKQFDKNAAPELQTLMNLHRTLVFKLSTAGNVDPEFLKLADQMTRTVMEFYSAQTKAGFKERELRLAEDKSQIAICEYFLKWFTDTKAAAIANSTSTNAQKIAELRKEYFKDVDELQASGKVVLPE